MPEWVVVVGPLAAVALALVVLLPLRPHAERLRAGTGVEEWRAEAAGYPWRDRWTIYRTNARGRDAPARLAAPAARRATVMLAMTERLLQSLQWRRFQRILTVVYALTATVWVVIIAADGGWELTAAGVVVVGAAALPLVGSSRAMLRRRACAARRSLMANQRQLDGDPSHQG